MKTFRIENYETNSAQTPSTLGFKTMALGIYGAYFALAVIYFWFGGMKFTHYEAVGLVPLVSNSPFLGWVYEIFSVDIREVSDRTLRVLINDFRRFAEQRQWQVIIPMMCQPVIEWFAEAAVLAGLITIDELDSAKRVEHAPHGWQYIHPVQDPQGKKMEVDAGFRSRSSVIAERGDDPDLVDDERQSDDKREQDMEIGPYSEALKVPEPADTQDPADQNDQQDDPLQK